MALTTHAGSPPAQVFAGDTLVWTYTRPDLTGDTLTFALRGASSVSVTGVEVSGVWTFTVTAAQTGGLTPGPHAWAVKATEEGGAAETLLVGSLTVLTNIGGTDASSHVRTMVAMLEAHIEGRAVDGIDSYTINGQMITKIPLAEAVRLHRYYSAELRRIDDAINAAAGLGGRGRYLTRFC